VTVKDIIPRVSGSLALSTATNLARNVYLLAWAVTDIEIQMNAVERLQHYHDRIPCEDGMPPGEDGGYDDFQGWPESGEVDIDKAYLKYKTRNTAALDNITLHVKKGQKIGVIGRTGS
jgi:ABC-type multidrug transport system fused ATPase/permease subunit